MNLHNAPEIVFFFLVGKECQARIGRAWLDIFFHLLLIKK